MGELKKASAAYPTIDAARTGKRMKMLMQQRGLSPKDIQKYLNLSCVQSVYHWLDGSSLPALDHLYALSELLCTPMDSLICGSKDKENGFCRRGMGRRGLAYFAAFRRTWNASA